MNVKLIKIILLFVIALVVLFIGGIFLGFPWEYVVANYRAKQYVKDELGLTPIKTSTGVSVVNALYGYIKVGVLVEEYDFNIVVSISRSRNYLGTGAIHSDFSGMLFNQRLTDHLKNYIEEKIKDKEGSFFLYSTMDTSFYKHPDYRILEIDEINSDVFFEEVDGHYYLNISFRNNKPEADYDINDEVDYELIYDIFQFIINGKSRPKRIYLDYKDDELSIISIISVLITSDMFDSINSPDDLIPLFQEKIDNIRLHPPKK